MAWTLIASAAAQSLDCFNATTTALNCTGANLLIMAVHHYQGNGGTNVPSDSSGNTWSSCTAAVAADNDQCQIFYVASPTVTSSQTFNFGNSASVQIFPGIAVYAFSGAATSSVLDVQNGDATGALQPGSITPSQGNSLIIAGMANQDDPGSFDTINDGFSTPLQSFNSGGLSSSISAAYLVQAAAAAINPTWTVPQIPVANVIVAFKPAAGGGTAESITDSVATADTFTDAMKVVEASSDSVATADTFGPKMVVPKSTTDSVATADTFGAALGSLSTSDSAATADTFGPRMVVAEAITDSVATADTFGPALGSLSISDSVATADAFTAAMTVAEALSDSVATADIFTASGGGVFTQSFSDTVATADTFGLTMVVPEALIDTLATADEFDFTNNATYALSLSDTLATTDEFDTTNSGVVIGTVPGPSDGDESQRLRWLEWARNRKKKRGRKGEAVDEAPVEVALVEVRPVPVPPSLPPALITMHLPAMPLPIAVQPMVVDDDEAILLLMED